MKILYATAAQSLSEEGFDNEANQRECKNALEREMIVKFCLFRQQKGDDILFVFPFALNIATFALGAIKAKGLNLTEKNFVCGGNTTEENVKFDSASCEHVFGQNTPPEGVNEQWILQALASDGFR